jgi:hypothetical protein
MHLIHQLMEGSIPLIEQSKECAYLLLPMEGNTLSA